MNLDTQTLSMERELRVYGESALMPGQSHAASGDQCLWACTFRLTLAQLNIVGLC